MVRLSRVGREKAIISAVRALNARGKHQMHTRGEICKRMGITSQSKIRDMLRDLVERGLLIGATTALDGYAHEVEIFGIAKYEQTPLPDDHVITINGVSMNMKGEVV